jgi:hypothetical protein
MVSFFVALVGCGQVPTDVKFAGEETVTVHTKDPVAVQSATVLDKDNKPMEAASKDLKWSVSPEGIAKLEGDKLVPEKNGKAMVKACATDTVCKEYALVVAMPDKVVVNGAEGVDWKVGATAPLTAKVMAGETEVADQKVEWASDNTAVVTVDEKGVATAVAPGTAKITAKSGEFMAETPITVTDGAAAAPPQN